MADEKPETTWDSESDTWDMETGEPFETEGGDLLELEDGNEDQ